LCTGYQKKKLLSLALALPMLQSSRIFTTSESATHTQQDCGDPLYMTGVMMYFRYYGKTKSLLFGLELPMHQSRSNWTNACILCSIRSVPSFIQISQQRWPKKPLFNS